MKKFNIILAIILFSALNSFSQNENDALRYSMTTIGGTARYLGVSGAFGALGADFSTLSTNPAGIGLYKKSEINFTPSIYMGKTSSTYQGKTGSDSKMDFNFGSAGWVFSFGSNKDKKDGWKSVNFGFGFNKNNNYDNQIAIEGENTKSSILNQYVLDAKGISYSNLDALSDAGMAFTAWLIDTLNGNSNYVSAVSKDVLQRKTITTTGGMNEMLISLGGNYSDKFYIGGTLGIPYVKYTETSTYSEFNSTDTTTGLKSFNINNEFSTSGNGVNFKLGIIVRPVDWVRIGASVHTPTVLNLKDKYSRSMTSHFDTASFDSEKLRGEFSYDITTPLRAIGSIGFIIGKIGLVSADYEYVDYSQARLNSSTEKFFEQNDAINTKLNATANIRVGTEWRLDPFVLRAGYALYGNPYKGGISNSDRTSYSGGFGIREDIYFIDFAWVHTTGSEDYYLDNLAVETPAKNTFSNNAFMITLGIRY
ncbi:MAG: hypothetical protein HXX09_05220 [Bacteroidetes bacterium]|nr:hypothetical protein [Bacteroidota bacterium]